jgi:signal transduction histidine kinase
MSDQRKLEVDLLLEVGRPVSSARSTSAFRPARLLSYTELHGAFERLQEEAQRTSATLGTAAHQLKTPLAIVAGYVDLLLSEKTGDLNERQRKILEESSVNCARLRKFVEDFLSFSALEAGRLTLKLEVSDLHACLSELRQYWLSSFKKKGVGLTLGFATGRFGPFPFDYDKVQHIVSNLLENALKFTPVGGKVGIAAEPHRWERRSQAQRYIGRERRRRSSSAPNTVRVSVSDTGPGIAPEYRQEIFDDFVQLSCGDEHNHGIGLGLAIARRFLVAHSGKIWVEENPGGGSIFRFLLPLNPS